MGDLRPTLTVGLDRQGLEPAGQALVALAMRDLRGAALPALYQSGVRYRREPPGQEVWQLPHQTMALGYGDCEDLASWRVAELRIAGENAKLVFRRSGRRLWHALVRRGNGELEDPSKILGMKGAA